MLVQCFTKVVKLAFFKLVLLFFLIFIGSISYIRAKPEEELLKLEKQYRDARNDSLKIEALFRISEYYSDRIGDKVISDSLGMKAIEIAQSSFRPQLLLMAYSSYLETSDLAVNFDKARKFALEAVKLSKLSGNDHDQWRSTFNLVEVYLAGYQFDKALSYSYQGFAIADQVENNEYKALSYLQIGRCLEGNNQKIEAFRNYLNASEIAEKSRNKGLLIKCYSQLSRFYNLNKLFAKAISYKLKEVALLESIHPFDSVAYMWTQYDLQTINMNSNNNNLSEASVRKILDFAMLHQLKRLKNYEIALYRSFLIEAEQMSKLYDFYIKEYPAEFNELLSENPALYYRLKAFFSEEQKRPDSAYIYLSKAEDLLANERNKILLSKFYFRFGQFLERDKQFKGAIQKYQKSYDLAKEASYLEYMINASGCLERMYYHLSDYREAYTFSALNHTLADSLNHLAEDDELLKLEIEHEGKQREIREQEIHDEVLRRHNIQYTAITIIIFTLFILLAMLGSLKVPEWTIRMLGFFSFILFFEFIIMIADHKIYEITENEPWKILLIKIGLIAFLLPFHHWIEKQVIHYLINHKLIDFSRISPMKMIRNKQSKVPKAETE